MLNHNNNVFLDTNKDEIIWYVCYQITDKIANTIGYYNEAYARNKSRMCMNVRQIVNYTVLISLTIQIFKELRQSKLYDYK